MKRTLKPEGDDALLTAIATETATMPNSTAWTTIGIRLKGVKTIAPNTYAYLHA